MCPYYLDGDLNSKSSVITRCPPAYRSGGLWLLCSFQGSSEKGRGRRVVTVDDVRAHGLSKLNSMQGSSSAICRALPVERGLLLGQEDSWPGQVRSTC